MKKEWKVSVCVVVFVTLIWPAIIIGQDITRVGHQTGDRVENGSSEQSQDSEGISDIFPYHNVFNLTVLDKDGQPFKVIKYSDISIKDNSKPYPIIRFLPIDEEPLSVVLMLDVSLSQERVISGAKAIASRFVEGLREGGADRIGVVQFSSRTDIQQNLTNRKAPIFGGIDRIKVDLPPGYDRNQQPVAAAPRKPNVPPDPPVMGTSIWDSVWQVCSTQFDVLPAKSRRVIVLFTDGEDTDSKKKFDEVVKYAIGEKVVIYCVGFADRSNYSMDTSKLKKLAKETGGLFYEPKQVADLTGLADLFSSHLRSGFTIEYKPDLAVARSEVTCTSVQIEIQNPALKKSNLRLSYPRQDCRH
ncbi:MAG: hypothetical protein QOH96_3343 [Blastocatellia bacterium]|nr:hypothetical protein [Blastocatellia bacterium]